MPEVHGEHLDVSAEEQRYLRRVFQRFALPYVLMGLVVGALAGAGPRWIDAQPEPAAAVEDPHLREQIAAMRGELAALSQRVVGAEAALAKTRDRLVELEGRSGSTEVGLFDTDELGRRFDAIGSRIEALETRFEAGGASAQGTLDLEQQLAKLGSRMARVEGELDGLRSQAPADLAR